MSAMTKASYKGVKYKDINWSQDIHSWGDHCPRCGIDGSELIMAGHCSGCDYYLMTRPEWDSPNLRAFVRTEIKEALERESAAKKVKKKKVKKKKVKTKVNK